MAEIIIITGTPGTGKTSLSDLVCKELGCKLFKTNKFIIDNEFFDEWDEERDTPIINHEKIKEFFLNFIKELPENARIIVEGHYFDFIPKKLVNKIIILRSYPSVLKERLENRGYNQSKINENVQAEILGNIMGLILEIYDQIPLFQLDTSHIDIEESKNLILNFLQDKISSTKVSDYIDWLPILEEKKELEQFFK